MSYSRWSNSRWYTYWHATESQFAEDQVLSVDCDFAFSYLDLKTNLEGCLERVSEKYQGYRKIRGEKKIRGQKRRKKKDLEELKGYMLEFTSDVEDCKDLIWDGFEQDPEGRRIAEGDW